MANTEKKTADQLFKEVGEHPTLDELARRDPRDGFTRSDLTRLVELLRMRRAAHIPGQVEEQDVTAS